MTSDTPSQRHALDTTSRLSSPRRQRSAGKPRPIAARILLLGLALAFAVVPPAFAVEPDEVLADTRLEARARAISLGLRCIVCQNQSVDDSNAPLARDLRLIVRERLKAGDTDEQVTAFVVARYGEFALLKPRIGWHTILLWLTPMLVLGALGGYALMRARAGSAGLLTQQAAHSSPSAASNLTAAEEARLAALLVDNGEGRPAEIALGSGSPRTS